MKFKFGHFSPKYQDYSLTFWPNIADLDHFLICNQNLSNLVIFHQNKGYSLALLFGQTSLIWITFNLQSKSINFNVGHFSPTYQDYSLTFWPKIADLDHFSICNQNQSISNLVISHQLTKAIALLLAKNR